MAKRLGIKSILAVLTAFTLGLAVPAGPGVSAGPPPVRPEEVSKLVINIPSRTLWIYAGDRIVHYYPVGLGRPGFMTPLGKFAVIRKIIDPGWEHPYKAEGAVRIAPGENNPLGSRWIGFHQYKGGEYGLHGTDNPGSVGRFSSHGCVRMKTPHIEALFELVDIGTPVEVTYDTVLIRPNGNDIRLVVFKDVFGRGMPTAQEVYARILSEHPQAQVDLERIQAALSSPNERPVSVGIRVAASQPAPAASDLKPPHAEAFGLPPVLEAQPGWQ